MAEDHEFTLPPLDERPLVTFALFSYNQENYIREAVEGALAQTYEPLEIILSDDCSTDRTFDIMKEIVEDYKGRHQVYLRKNSENVGRKAYGTRVSDLLDSIETDFVILAAGDDISLPMRTEQLVKRWLKQGKPLSSYHSNFHIIDSNSKITSYNQGRGDGFNDLAQVISKDGYGLLGATHGFSTKVYSSFGSLLPQTMLEDGAIGFRALLLDGVDFIDTVLVHYRKHDDNLTTPWTTNPQEFLNKRINGQITMQLSFINDINKHNTPNHNTQELINKCNKRIHRLKLIRHLQHYGPIGRSLAGFLYFERSPFSTRASMAWSIFKQIKKFKKGDEQ